MKVLVTGASGFVGSAVLEELLKSRHQVLGLARSDASAKKIEALGGKVLRGDLDDLATVRKGATDCDAIIHCGFNHDFTKFKENCEADRRVILEMGSAIEGTDKPLVVTSGIGVLASGHLLTEKDKVPTPSPNPRAATERAVMELAEKGLNVRIVRLPPSVHGDGDHGFVPMLIGIAKERGGAAYIGEGANKWPAVHRKDAAKLYRLALERGEKGGVYHAVAEDGIEFKKIAQVIGKKLGLSTQGKTGDAASQYFTWFEHFAGMDLPASSAETQRALGWEPDGVGLLQDMESGTYFKGAQL